MNESLTKRNLSSLAPLLLFAVFTACTLMVLLSGADIYHKIAKRDQDSIRQRTVSQYLTTRLHQSDADGMVLVGSFTDSLTQHQDTLTGDTLYLQEHLNGHIYYTRIYIHDGMLRELFAADGLTFEPSGGTAILPLKDLHYTLQDQLLIVEITHEDDTTETLYLTLRNGSHIGKEGSL